MENGKTTLTRFLISTVAVTLPSVTVAYFIMRDVWSAVIYTMLLLLWSLLIHTGLFRTPVFYGMALYSIGCLFHLKPVLTAIISLSGMVVGSILPIKCSGDSYSVKKDVGLSMAVILPLLFSVNISAKFTEFADNFSRHRILLSSVMFVSLFIHMVIAVHNREKNVKKQNDEAEKDSLLRAMRFILDDIRRACPLEGKYLYDYEELRDQYKELTYDASVYVYNGVMDDISEFREKAYFHYGVDDPYRKADAELKYFKDCNSMAKAKAMYKKLCISLHPDNGGNADEFMAMNSEYQMIKKKLGEDGDSADHPG